MSSSSFLSISSASVPSKKNEGPSPMLLNKDQQEAVTITDQHVLVLAGAGSGKTRVITAKIFHLVKNLGISPHSILAVTFTNKAAGEMKARVAQLLGKDNRALNSSVLTFHAFGVKFLRMFIHLFPKRQNDFLICDDGQKKAFLKEIFKAGNLDLGDIKEVSRFISLCKNKLLFSDSEDLSKQTEFFFSFKLAAKKHSFLEIYKRYENLLIESNRVDFDDLIMLTLRLLYEEPIVREYIGKRWKYLLVDEYQDTDFAQEKIIESFVKQGTTVTVVGDDNQSIYGFRGAEVSNILSFPRKYPNVKRVILEQNYRSTAYILNLANEIILHNPNQFAKKLLAQRTIYGEKPVFLKFKSDNEEAVWIANNIMKLKAGGVAFSEMAIFYRTNYQSRVIEDHLVRARIPYRVVKGFRFYERKEIKEVLAYLNFISNPKDRLALKACINVPKRAIGEQTLKVILEHSAGREENMITVLEEPELFAKLSSRVQRSLKDFVNFIKEVKNTLESGKPLNQVIEQVIRKSGLWKHYDQLPDKYERDQRLGSLTQLIHSGGDFSADYQSEEGEPLGEGQLLITFLESISLAGNEDANAPTDGVNLLTVHNAKGLEYPVVHVIGMEEGVFPHFLSMGEKSQVEEERRLFYVAVTRAMYKLFLSSAEIKQVRGDLDFFNVSRFLKEIPFSCFGAESSSLIGENER